ncbi:MAG: N-acetylmuramoyl-L-alanine amidase [Pseudomonadales bacterium RIFCSPLOWO2_12_60_38]|uniref:N-acetylmuramoyl-L-alanine amidase n=1 Tax=Pseudomonas TaxID=286 RepID=UPI0003DCE23A|nr:MULTISPECIES: N-acetylmuramoyl-L-alanine amidase [unclassified Pseudomonas]ETK42974.1 N-acetylmuramoyl-L-alanine amidase [Pseudomonas fluorescens FH5]OHC35450.1 MAG: N-acetylmuramoyl-L-alanine amidase [Pseudomonadales bacterium RIFCSPLOWO2_12_60_38]OHC41786.1 MAG: N-acetylmuramoyl-L-alanine amidase [Pseudomonadales bacterium RIFCSPLOWO2_12_FULL_59_450]PTT15557.1 N-acetylmuramoyl-L-alanine amidase [Pseudomonas sp. HMWF034]PVV74262.1 N-acetylmuramoyl-L-alanine amidase [Pseudomonas sp. HMWF011
MHRRQLLNLLLVSPLFALPLGAHATQIRNARLWRSDDKLRLVFDLSGPVQYKTFSLTSPDRLIIDLSGAGLSGDFSQLALKNSGITSIRSGHFGQSDTRIVLDLVEPMQLNSFVLPPQEGQGHRLVLDLTNATRAPRQIAAEPAPLVAPVDKAHPKRDIIVVVDPGHGGKDPGAIGSKGQREKDVVLSIAQLLAKRLKREKGFDVKLVRNDDFFVPLRKRVDIARQHKADMFISVHADAAPRLTASGASVYALSEGGATSATARFMAQRENGADLLGATTLLNLKDKDPMLAGVILDMSMNATIASSLQLGSSVLGSLQSITSLHQKRVEQAGFAVLKSPDVPSILVETGFISNPRDAQRLVTARHQQAVADGLFEGLKRYFQKNPPMNSYMAWVQAQKNSQA